MSHTNESLGKQARDKAQRQIGQIALAGLHRPAYTGVLRRSEAVGTPRWVGDIYLDGYRRQVRITVWRRTGTAPSEDAVRFVGRVSGLAPFFRQRDLTLTETTPTTGSKYLRGRIDLGVATLGVRILRVHGVTGQKILCLLEVLQAADDADSEQSSSSPLG